MFESAVCGCVRQVDVEIVVNTTTEATSVNAFKDRVVACAILFVIG